MPLSATPTASQGAMSRLALSADGTTYTRLLSFAGEGLAMTEELLDGNGMAGELAHEYGRVRRGKQRVGGNLSLQPNAQEWADLLQWMMWGTPTGTGTVTYPLSDTPALRTAAVDRNSGQLATYPSVAVDSWTLRGSEGQIVGLELDLVGTTEALGGSFPTGLSVDEAATPFVFQDLVISVAGTTVAVKEFSLAGKRMTDRDRYFNSQSLAGIVSQDRAFSWSLTVPNGAYYALNGSANAAVVATFTNGSHVLALTSNHVEFPRHSPSVQGRKEVMLPLQGTAYRSGTDYELSVTFTG